MTGFGHVWLLSSRTWRSVAWLGLACSAVLAIVLLPSTWAAMLILGAIAAILTLLRPQLGLLLIMVAVPFGSLRQVQLGTMSVGLTEVTVALVLAGWCMQAVARHFAWQKPIVPDHGRGPGVSRRWLALPFLLFLGASLLSLLVSSSLQSSLKEIVKWVEMIALYLFVAAEVDERWARVLVFVTLGVGAVAALQGIYQFLFRIGPEAFVLFGRFMRAYGTFEQPNPYGGYLGLTLPLAGGIAVAGLLGARERVPKRWLIWAVGCGSLMLLAAIMSWSRGAWLGLAAAAAAIVFAVVSRSGRAAILVVVFLLLVAYVVLAGGLAHVPASIVQRFSDFVPYLSSVDVRGAEITDANFAVLERMAHWQAAWGMWTDHPWLGVGIGNYEQLYAQYALPMWPAALGHAHNYYLNIAAETGIVGLSAYLLLWGVALAGAWRATRSAAGWRWGAALGVLGVLVHLSVHNVFDNLFVHGMYLQVAILLGLVPLLSRKLSGADAYLQSD